MRARLHDDSPPLQPSLAGQPPLRTTGLIFVQEQVERNVAD